MRIGDVDSGEYEGVQEATRYTTQIALATPINDSIRRPLDNPSKTTCNIEAGLLVISDARFGITFSRFEVFADTAIGSTILWNWISTDTRLGKLGKRTAARICGCIRDGRDLVHGAIRFYQ